MLLSLKCIRIPDISNNFNAQDVEFTSTSYKSVQRRKLRDAYSNNTATNNNYKVKVEIQGII